MQVSPKAELHLIQPLLKNQQLTGITAQKTVRTIDETKVTLVGKYPTYADAILNLDTFLL